MPSKPLKIFVWALCCMVLTPCILSCGFKTAKDDIPVAKVGDKYLYFSELKDIFPKGVSGEDSTALAKLYIDNWIKTRLLLKRAELNLSGEQLNISEEIETYRTSLLIYRYEDYLLQEKLDTAVFESEIQNYYEDNMANFSSEEYAVRAIYIKLPTNAPNQWKVRQWYMSDQEKDIQALTDYCRSYAEGFNFFDDEWVNWAEVEKELPQKETATRLLTQYNRIEQQDKQFNYYVRIKEKRVPGDTAPLVFVKDKVKSIIINKRKLKFVSELEKNIYNDALVRKQFTIYKLD